MIDFRLEGGKLAFSAGQLGCVDGAERVRQQVEFRLSLFRDEWFLDSEFGTPYFADVLGKQMTINAGLATIKQQILAVEGVSGLSSFSYRLDRHSRRLTIQCDIQTDYGIVHYP